MSAVVGDGGSFLEIRRRQFRRQGVQLEHKQAKAADVRSPAPQMAKQIFFQHVAGNLFAKMNKRAGGFPRPSSFDVVHGRKIRAIVVEERTDVQQVVNVEADPFEIARQMCRAVKVAPDHVIRGDPRLAQSLLGHTASHLVEIDAHNDQRMLIKNFAPSRPVLDNRVEMFEECAITAAHVEMP